MALLDKEGGVVSEGGGKRGTRNTSSFPHTFAYFQIMADKALSASRFAAARRGCVVLDGFQARFHKETFEKGKSLIS